MPTLASQSSALTESGGGVGAHESGDAAAGAAVLEGAAGAAYETVLVQVRCFDSGVGLRELGSGCMPHPIPAPVPSFSLHLSPCCPAVLLQVAQLKTASFFGQEQLMRDDFLLAQHHCSFKTDTTTELYVVERCDVLLFVLTAVCHPVACCIFTRCYLLSVCLGSGCCTGPTFFAS